MSEVVNNETGEVTQAEVKPVQPTGELVYTPMGQKHEIKLSNAIVKKYLCRPTKSGKMPDDQEIMKYMVLCRARELNPFEGDAYLVGYDSQDGPMFSLIAAIQSMYKRAEVNPDYDGIESGVIVLDSNKAIVERHGDFCCPGDTLLGGWAKVYRKNQSHPVVERLNTESRDKKRSLWNSDKAGMISKCAEAAALRRAFPNQLSGLYAAGEIISEAAVDEAIAGEGPAAAIKELPTGKSDFGFKRDASGKAIVPEPAKVIDVPAKAVEPKPEPKAEPKPEPKPEYTEDGHLIPPDVGRE